MEGESDVCSDRVTSLVSLPQDACALSVTSHDTAQLWIMWLQLINISKLDDSATERLFTNSPAVHSLTLAGSVTKWARNSEFLWV